MGCRLFISDCHISAGLGLDTDASNPHPWEWLTRPDQARLLGFLKWVTTRAARGTASVPKPVDEVVLLGDIFDSWIFPHDVKPLAAQPAASRLFCGPHGGDR